MDAKPLSIGRIMSERQRFVVPIYQRTYSWTVRKQLQQFFEQVRDKAADRLDGRRAAFSHYMGALLVIPENETVFGRIQTYNIVDGQQRLTTFHLFYAALRDMARSRGFTNIERQLADVLVHTDDTPMEDPRNERYKLQPTSYDRKLFRDLIDLDWKAIVQKYSQHFYKNQSIRETGTPNPLRAWWYFWDEAMAFVDEASKPSEQEDRLRALSTALYEDFRLIVITLSKEDDAQVIFETLNNGGEPLTAMDLVRNDVFHRASASRVDVERLLEDHWAVFETDFWKQEQTQGRIKKPRIDFYLAHTLAAEQGNDVSLSELYAEYKQFVVSRKFTDSIAELNALTKYAGTYRNLVAPAGHGPLDLLASRLEVFDVSTAYPLVFVVAAAETPNDVKARLYTLIASYIIRCALCGLTAKSYNKTFVRLAAAMSRSGVSEETMAVEFAGLEGDATRFPTDGDLQKTILTRQQYRSIPQNRLRLILEEIELAVRDKFDEAHGMRDDLTIEHILPDSWTEFWPLSDGRSVPEDKITGVDEEMRRAMDERDILKHTLGNLTLLTPAANPSVGKRAFAEKQIRLRQSLLKMNQKVAELPVWNDDSIRARAEELATTAVKIWPAPQRSKDSS